MLRKALGAVKRAVQGVPGVPDLFFAELSSEKGKQSFKDVRPPAAAAAAAVHFCSVLFMFTCL